MGLQLREEPTLRTLGKLQFSLTFYLRIGAHARHEYEF